MADNEMGLLFLLFTVLATDILLALPLRFSIPARWLLLLRGVGEVVDAGERTVE